MTGRNIFDQTPVEDVELPAYPEDTQDLAVVPETEEDLADLDALIAKYEGEEDLTTTAQALLNQLLKARDQARSPG